jgi:hypothetical protein
MRAYKLQGKIDDSGKLIVSEAIDLPAGDVEIILLREETNGERSTPATEEPPQPPERKVDCKIKALKEWFEKNEPVPPDFDPDRAKWEYLKEKHDL